MASDISTQSLNDFTGLGKSPLASSARSDKIEAIDIGQLQARLSYLNQQVLALSASIESVPDFKIVSK